jgi:predicted ribonuclease YlaK
MKRLIDTNILLDNPQILNEPDIVLSVKVLKELDGLKRSVNEEIAEKARRAAIYISRKISELEFSLEDENIPTDN